MTPPAPRPTVRGVAALVAFGLVVVAAAATGTPELTPLAVVIGVPLVVGPWLAHRRARIAIAAMEFHAHAEPAAAEVGSEMQVKLSLTNRSTHGPFMPSIGLPPIEGQWKARGTVRRVARQRQWMAPPVLGLLSLPNPGPGLTERCSLGVPTGRRGVFELPPQTCWLHDALGLFGAPGPTTPAVIAVVHPLAVSPGMPITRRPFAMTGTGADRVSGSGGGLGDLEGIRPYVPGDRLSLLHWPAKARYGTWFVRQFDAEGATVVPLVLDDRAGVHRRSDFERLVSATLWAVDDAMRVGQAVVLLTLSGRTLSLPPTAMGRAEARLVLAELQPAPMRSATLSTLPIPAEAVVLTTRTGAERMTRPPGLITDVDVAHDQVSSDIRSARVVVI
jgi:uncharacterized protein (DUF58 family)